MKPSPPQICSVLLVLIGAAWFGVDLGGGSLQRYDEFSTALRTLSFVESGDWFSITTNYEPVFKKPPL
jgi:4-amino-4-deoxy-L-arabinose transferase-like glycosyltransferase